MAREKRIALLSIRSLDGLRGPSRGKISAALSAALADLPARRYVVEIVYAGDREMRRLNAQYSKSSRITDVLAFPAHQELPGGEYLLGEVIVNREEAARREGEGGGATRELIRYIVHGVLHMAGYDDANPKLREAMWRKQEKIMAGLSKTNGKRQAHGTP